MHNEPTEKDKNLIEVSAHVWEPLQTSKKSRKEDVQTPDPSSSISKGGSPRRLRERSSWRSSPLSVDLGIAQGNWKQTRLRLVSEGSGCKLNICSENLDVLQTIFPHLLSQTDVRRTHQSLLFRKNVLSLHCRFSQALGLPNSDSNADLASRAESSLRGSSSHTGSPWPAFVSSHAKTQSLDPSSSFSLRLTPKTAPIHIAFSSPEIQDAWLVLLRSYAQPEVHGSAYIDPVHGIQTGGGYRLWRAIDLEVVECRRLPLTTLDHGGSTSFFGRASPLDDAASVLRDGPVAASEYHILCEIFIDDLLCGRTTAKQGNALQGAYAEPSVIWHERFNWTELSSPNMLSINVWKMRSDKEKAPSTSNKERLMTGVALLSSVGGLNKKEREPVLIGRVEINLARFRRGEWVEGWWPITMLPALTVGWMHGSPEVKLRLKFQEVTILPRSAYRFLWATLDELANECHGLIPTCIPSPFVSLLAPEIHHVFLETSLLIPMLQESLTHEIGTYADNLALKSSSSPNTLFRGNTQLTKSMEFAMMRYGRRWLDRSLGVVIRKIILERVSIETDIIQIERRMGASGTASEAPLKEQEVNVQRLLFWIKDAWAGIWNFRGECPDTLRALFETIRKEVDSRFTPASSRIHRHRSWREGRRKDYSEAITAETDSEEDEPSDKPSQPNLKWQAVSAFVFLRFFVPAILHPHLFGLTEGLPLPRVQKSLKHLAKALQSLANINANADAEGPMRSVSSYLQNQKPVMVDFLLFVSTPINTGATKTPMDLCDTDGVERTLAERLPILPPLLRDAIPALPHLVDPARHFAVIASTVVRNSHGSVDDVLPVKVARAQDIAEVNAHADLRWKRLEAECFAVEAEAIARSRTTTLKGVSIPQRSRSLSKQRARSAAPPMGGSPSLPTGMRDTAVSLGHDEIHVPDSLRRRARRVSNAADMTDPQLSTTSSILAYYGGNASSSSSNSLSDFVGAKEGTSFGPKAETRTRRISGSSSSSVRTTSTDAPVNQRVDENNLDNHPLFDIDRRDTLRPDDASRVLGSLEGTPSALQPPATDGVMESPMDDFSADESKGYVHDEVAPKKKRKFFRTILGKSR